MQESMCLCVCVCSRVHKKETVREKESDEDVQYKPEGLNQTTNIKMPRQFNTVVFCGG